MENEKLNEMLKGLRNSLTDEQKAKAKECKTVDELVELAGGESIELPDELLDAVSGGHIYHWEESEKTPKQTTKTGGICGY